MPAPAPSRTAGVGLVLLAAVAGCAAPSGDEPPTTPPPPKAAYAFAEAVPVEAGNLSVNEPAILADPSGALWMAGPTDFVSPALERDPEA